MMNTRIAVVILTAGSVLVPAFAAHAKQPTSESQPVRKADLTTALRELREAIESQRADSEAARQTDRRLNALRQEENELRRALERQDEGSRSHDSYEDQERQMLRAKLNFDWSEHDREVGAMLKQWSEHASIAAHAPRVSACAPIYAELKVLTAMVRNERSSIEKEKNQVESSTRGRDAGSVNADDKRHKLGELRGRLEVLELRERHIESLSQEIEQITRRMPVCYPADTDFGAMSAAYRARNEEQHQTKNRLEQLDRKASVREMTPEQVKKRLLEVAREVAEIEVKNSGHRDRWQGEQRAENMLLDVLRGHAHTLVRQEVKFADGSIALMAPSEWRRDGSRGEEAAPTAWSLIYRGTLYRVNISNAASQHFGGGSGTSVFEGSLAGTHAKFDPSMQHDLGIAIRTPHVFIRVMPVVEDQLRHGGGDAAMDGILTCELIEVVAKLFDLTKL